MYCIKCSESLLNKLGKWKLILLNEHLFKLGLCAGVLGGEHCAAVLVGLDRGLKRPYLSGYLNYLLLIHTYTGTEYGHIYTGIGNAKRLHGL